MWRTHQRLNMNKRTVIRSFQQPVPVLYQLSVSQLNKRNQIWWGDWWEAEVEWEEDDSIYSAVVLRPVSSVSSSSSLCVSDDHFLCLACLSGISDGGSWHAPTLWCSEIFWHLGDLTLRHHEPRCGNEHKHKQKEKLLEVRGQTPLRFTVKVLIWSGICSVETKRLMAVWWNRTDTLEFCFQ